MKNFEGFGLSPALNKSLNKMGYSTPTPIQAAAIPVALKGRDILGSAQTGTGKTAAFSIPLVEMLMRSEDGMAVVLTPTRELAKQVLTVIHQLLGYNSPIKTAFIIGGEQMGKQFRQLRDNPRVIVGTPGRINDHLDRGSLDLSDANFLVLDETDRMLDMGFGVQLDRIAQFLPPQRQTLMFSATMPDEIVQMSGKYLQNPERIKMGETNAMAANIQQDYMRIDQAGKYPELVNQLHDRSGSIIIFAKTKHGCDKLAKNLSRDGFQTDALHGDLRQSKRDKVMRAFRDGRFRILVATDVAARGLDVPHIEHVINYDLPQVAEDYIHRMGRTARAGAKGYALSFVSPQDGRKWHAIEILLDPFKKTQGGNAANSNKKKKKPRRSGGRPDGKRFDDKRNGPKKPRRKDAEFKARDEKHQAKRDGKPRADKHTEKRTDKRTERSAQGKPDSKKKFGGKSFVKSHGKPGGKPAGKKSGGFKGKPRHAGKPQSAKGKGGGHQPMRRKSA